MAVSPMMQHYLQVKDNYKDAIVFYRLGDFYEMFYDDAKLVSRELDLTLTAKACGLEDKAPMCGMPFHSVDFYIAKLLKKGYKIAICEQLTEAQKGQRVDRDVVRVITPGTITEDNMLEEKRNNYILCVHKNAESIGIAYSDISTGEFFTTEFKEDGVKKLNDLITRISPSEIICSNEAKFLPDILPAYKLTALPKFQEYYDYVFDYDNAVSCLKKQFSDLCLSVFEIKNMSFAISACGALIEYIKENQKQNLVHIKKIYKIEEKNYLILDVSARKNLEIVETIRDRTKKGSLLSVLDKTKTNMGGRKMRNWIDEPIVDSKEINDRLNAVEELISNLIARENLSDELSQIADIERLSTNVAMNRINPRDCVALKNSLGRLPKIKELISGFKAKKISEFYLNIPDFSEVVSLIDNAFMEWADCSNQIREGGYIKPGFNKTLDEFRNAREQGAFWVNELENKEKEETGIKNLKIRYNSVFGYYIEVSKSQIMDVPLRYERKQTTANSERYITQELKELEEKVLNAEDNALKLEIELFETIRQNLAKYIEQYQAVSKIISELDCLLSFAYVSSKNKYCKPKINDRVEYIKIIEGRHPVVETYLKDEQFISNDTYLDQKEDKVMVITGPNMAGKSTYMRQVALITLMAHIGCFVPAKTAEIAITDRIFTRVGASDDLVSGQSTFMVEMSEMANILNNATSRSLLILDEIGRGTSTFDGLSIAWAVVEHLSKQMNAKTLFATHYHELTELEGFLQGVKNYKITVKEINNTIVFLRKITRGGANRSFGIKVASLAGLPNEVIERAKEISHNLEASDLNNKFAVENLNASTETLQKSKNFNEIIGILKDINIEKMTPLGAFDTLNELVNKAKN